MRTRDGEPGARQLYALYSALLGQPERYRQFKQLLHEYPRQATAHGERERAAVLLDALNARLRDWLGASFEGLSARELLLWRSIIVEQRFMPPETVPSPFN